jgi:hypothetical protein
MRAFRDALFSVSLCTLLLGAICWLYGFTPAALTDGLWQDTGDHPTNWADAALHPDTAGR